MNASHSDDEIDRGLAGGFLRLSQTQRKVVEAIIADRSENIRELAKIADLNPKTHFQNADLSGVDFGTDDVSGFDFSGADLTGANFEQASGVDLAVFNNAKLQDTLWPPGFSFNRSRTTLSAAQTDPKFLAIQQLPLFAGLPNEILEAFTAHARLRSCVAGEIVIEAGDTKEAEVFIIIEGSVRVINRTAFGYEVIQNDLTSGDFFNEAAAIDGGYRSVNVTALSDTRFCVIPGAAFIDIVLSSREVALRLMSLLLHRLRDNDDRLVEYQSLSVRQRLIAELLRLSHSRDTQERVISPPPPQHLLAARIGTRRKSVSREMAELLRSGLITVNRRSVILHSPDKLRAEIVVHLRTGQSTLSVPPTKSGRET